MRKGALKGLRAVITGASRGIGAAITRCLADEGVYVLLVARKITPLENIAAEIRKKGVDVYTLSADMTDISTPQRIITEARDRLGGLDILVNNAGTASNISFEKTTLEEWDHIMHLNARAPFLLCQQALPLLRESAHPVVLNVSSVVGRKGYARQAAYSASKHALMGFSKALAKEVQHEGIRVVSLAPGATATDLIKEVRPDLDAGDLITPEEIAETALFLIQYAGNGAVDEINIRRSTGTPWD